MKNVSILGCGWLGLALGKEMVQRNFKVKGSVTKPEKVDRLRSANIEPHIFDWNEGPIPSEFFNCDIMVITIPPSTSNYKKNFANFIASLEHHKVEKVIYTSASSVYRDCNREVTEQDAEYIVSPHSGLALLEIEDILTESKLINATILRFAGLYGPDRIPGKFLAGKKNISGGNKPVNLIHRDDCIEIIIRLAEQEIWGETFNACSDFHPSRKEFYTTACLNQLLEAPVFSTEEKKYKIVNSDKLKKHLNYSFIHVDPMKDI